MTRTTKRRIRTRTAGGWSFEQAHQYRTMPGIVSAGPGVLERPEVDHSRKTAFKPLWIVTVYDNDVNTYEEVMAVLMRGTGCTAEEAYIEAWEIDKLGSSVVHHAMEDECRFAAEVISSIGIQVEVSEE